MLGAIVRWWKSNCQLNPKGIPAIDILDVQLLCDGKQSKDEEAVVRGLVTVVRNPLVSELVVLPVVFEDVFSKREYIALFQARSEG